MLVICLYDSKAGFHFSKGKDTQGWGNVQDGVHKRSPIFSTHDSHAFNDDEFCHDDDLTLRSKPIGVPVVRPDVDAALLGASLLYYDP